MLWFFLTGLMIFGLWVCFPSRGEVIGDGPNVGQIESGIEHRSNRQSWVLGKARAAAVHLQPQCSFLSLEIWIFINPVANPLLMFLIGCHLVCCSQDDGEVERNSKQDDILSRTPKFSLAPAPWLGLLLLVRIPLRTNQLVLAYSQGLLLLLSCHRQRGSEFQIYSPVVRSPFLEMAPLGFAAPNSQGRNSERKYMLLCADCPDPWAH
jgi:hypothetical protein